MDNRIMSASDHFQFDEEKHVPFKKFFHLYKDQFPMLAVIVEGWYGQTRYDCFDNFQVVRIHCYTTQPRVVCINSDEAKADKYRYMTAPVNYPDLLYKVIKGHTTVGEPQTLEDILKENNLPVLVALACDPRHSIKLDSSSTIAKHFGNLLITEKFDDHYFLMNCVDGSELKMNSEMCIAMLSDELTATPITGFKYQSKDKFEEFLRQIDHQVATSGVEYDKTMGDPAFIRYDSNDPNAGKVEAYTVPDANLKPIIQSWSPSEPAPDVPERKPRLPEDIDDENDGDYEEIDEIPPPIPGRSHITKPESPEQSTSITVKEQKGKKDKHEAKSKGTVDTDGKKTKWGFFHVSHTKPEIKSPHSTDKHETRHVKDIASTDKHETRHVKDIAISRTSNESKQPQSCPKQKPDYQNTKIGRAHVKPLQQEHDSAMHVTAIETNRFGDRPEMPVPAVDELDVYSDMYEELATEPSGHRLVEGCQSTSRITSKQDNIGAIDTKANVNNDTCGESIGDDTNKEFSIRQLTIKDLAKVLETLKLGKYTEVFKDNDIDGEMLTSLSVEDLVNELNMKKLEAIKVYKYVRTGHIPR